MTLVKKTFFVFLTAFLVQIAVMSVLIAVGYRQSENDWRSVRSSQAEETARAFLTNSPVSEGAFEFPGQIAIYDADGMVVGTNRNMGMGFGQGMARNLQEAELIPVRDNNDVIIGYFSTGAMNFGQDSANRALLDSMGLVMMVAALFSLGISLLAALYFARIVSRPADRIAESLQRMIDGDLSQSVDAQGAAEMARISLSIETLRQRLLSERTIRTQWSQDFAHDLRTPVASIKAQIEGMSDGVLPVTSERFDRTTAELGRMERLIDDLEELMRLESPETRVAMQPIDANRFAQDARGRFEALAVQKGVRFTIMVSIPTFPADENLLSRAISNVLSNAIRHCEKNGTVTFEISGNDQKTLLSVHNTGDPIPADEIPKVFDRLYRGEYARNTPGSGLGLTIADRIARLHDGMIGIESKEGMGTKITFILPVR